MRLDENAFSATLLVVGAAGGSASSLCRGGDRGRLNRSLHIVDVDCRNAELVVMGAEQVGGGIGRARINRVDERQLVVRRGRRAAVDTITLGSTGARASCSNSRRRRWPSPVSREERRTRDGTVAGPHTRAASKPPERQRPTPPRQSTIRTLSQSSESIRGRARPGAIARRAGRARRSPMRQRRIRPTVLAGDRSRGRARCGRCSADVSRLMLTVLSPGLAPRCRGRAVARPSACTKRQKDVRNCTSRARSIQGCPGISGKLTVR